MKTLLGENSYLSFTLVAMLISVVVWAVRQESHAANDAIQIKYVSGRLDIHEDRQNKLEDGTLQYLVRIDQRLSRIEGKLGVK